jgi:hypothetical protein
MNREDIIKLAQKWGDWNGQTAEFNDVGLVRFAALIAEREREECAKLCETYETASIRHESPSTAMIFNHCAKAIRARGETK